MKTFPVKTSDKYSSEMCSYYYEICLPKLEWGKKLYILFKNEVRAAIPLCSYLVKTKGGTMNVTFVRFNIAGQGVRDIELAVFRGKMRSGIIKMFRTKDDYNAYYNGKKEAEFFPTSISMDELVQIHGLKTAEDSTWNRAVLGWYMDKFEPKQDKIRFKDVWLDEDGAHITFVPVGYYPNDTRKFFLTKEECLAANRREVIDFEDEEPVQEDQQWIVNLPKTVAVTAKTAEEAEQIVKEAINNIVK